MYRWHFGYPDKQSCKMNIILVTYHIRYWHSSRSHNIVKILGTRGKWVDDLLRLIAPFRFCLRKSPISSVHASWCSMLLCRHLGVSRIPLSEVRLSVWRRSSWIAPGRVSPARRNVCRWAVHLCLFSVSIILGLFLWHSLCSSVVVLQCGL